MWFYDPVAEYQDLLREQAKEKAEFCLRTGVAPSEYDNLSQVEIEAFIKEANKQAERGKK